MNHTSLGQPAHILLVDDDPVDVRLTLESLQEGKIHLLCDVVRDGVEAMAFLRRQGEHVGASHPDLILLDLNMPRKDGREVLAEMRADPALRHIPVVILTTSQADEDVLSTYNLGANCYITKPVDFEQFTKVVQSIEDFWFTIVRLPKD